MSGTTLTWVGGGDNNVNDPADWSPAQAPAAGDQLVVNSGTLNLTGDWLAGDLVSVDGQTALAVFNVFADASLDANLGYGMPNFGTVDVNIAAGATLALSGGVSGDNAFHVTGGTVLVAGTENLGWGQSTLDSALIGSGTIDIVGANAAGAEVELQGPVSTGLTFSLGGGAPAASLVIDQPHQFEGQLQLGRLFQYVELKGLTATSVIQSNGVLQLYDNGSLVDAVRTQAGTTGVEVWQGSQGVFLTAGGQSYAPVSGATQVAADPPPAGQNFYLQDETTGKTSFSAGVPYTGPVAGLTNELVLNTSDILNVTALTPNSFIEVAPVPGSPPPSAAGINASGADGNNVLDGYGNSNFYTGGTGTDQFYEDTRTLTQSSWSTVVNFHSGDNLTLWGVTPSDFGLNWIGDTYGAPGSTGLTGVLVPTAGGQEVGLTLAGYTTADLTNGRLSITYGQTGAQGSTPGSSYLSIHAT